MKETILKQHIIITPPNGPKNDSHEMRPLPPQGAGGTELALRT